MLTTSGRSSWFKLSASKGVVWEGGRGARNSERRKAGLGEGKHAPPSPVKY